MTPTTASSTTRAIPDRTRLQMERERLLGGDRRAPATARSGTVMARTAAGWADMATRVAGTGFLLRVGRRIVAGWSGSRSAIRTTPTIATATTARLSSMDTTEAILPGETGPAPPEPARRRPWMVVLAALGLLLPAGGVAGQLVTLPYDSIGPGSARDVSGLVTVKDHPSYPPQGRILYTTVSVRERVNLFEALAGWLDPATDVVPEQRVRGEIPPEEYRQLNVEAMADSKTTAQVVALRHLGFNDLGAGAEILSVQEGLPASPLLKAGDVVVALDGRPVRVASDAVTGIRARKPGETVRLTIVRGGSPPVDVEAGLATGDEGRPLLGVRLGDKIKLPFQIDIESGRVIGPSAGLAYALEVLEVLTPGELTGGMSVAATGELRSDGAVGPIGGVAQKAVTVQRAGAKVFLVPRENLDEAEGAEAKGLQVHPVDSFDEALKVLGSLQGSNALALGRPPPAA